VRKLMCSDAVDTNAFQGLALSEFKQTLFDMGSRPNEGFIVDTELGKFFPQETDCPA
jgi:hypothetical protein